jgi:hypothetical protein
MYLHCDWYNSMQGTIIGLMAKPRNLPSGALYRCTYSLERVGAGADAFKVSDETDVFGFSVLGIV